MTEQPDTPAPDQPTKRPGGRPSKLTPERANAIVDHISRGAYAAHAAHAAGIHEATYHAWMARGRDAALDDDGYPTNPDDDLYVEFHEAVKKAEAEAACKTVAKVFHAAEEGTWQAAAWWLERKYADQWGRKDHLRQEVSGPNGGPVHVDAKTELLGMLVGRRDPELDPLTDQGDASAAAGEERTDG